LYLIIDLTKSTNLPVRAFSDGVELSNLLDGLIQTGGIGKYFSKKLSTVLIDGLKPKIF
jgi:hypothetical protein